VIKDITLNRQLKHFGLTETEIPKDLNVWCQFLLRVERTYKEFENARYTNERALKIVSKEMQELFASLENAEKISSMGSWLYNPKTKWVRWSNELYTILGREPTLSGLTYEEFALFVFPEDRKGFEKSWVDALESGSGEFIFRIVLETEVRWVHLRIRRIMDENNVKTDMVGGTLTDITEQKEAESALAKLNSQLIASSKRAGMAEVASSVLHNIGNVLNSLSVSSQTINNIITNTKISNLKKIAELISEHKDNLGNYLTMDPKGKYIPNYIESLALYWIEEKNNLVQNVNSLDTHIQHIKEVVAKQQSLSGFFGVTQPISVSELLEDAVAIVFPETGEGKVKIKRNYKYSNKILADKVNYIQIFVNLIRNAKDSLDSSPRLDKLIALSVELKNPEIVEITIEDNGSGIALEHFQKLFSYGFTTKSKGSGIGLHASILSIREMGGDLKAYSAGTGKGAKFVLEVPNRVAKL